MGGRGCAWRAARRRSAPIRTGGGASELGVVGIDDGGPTTGVEPRSGLCSNGSASHDHSREGLFCWDLPRSDRLCCDQRRNQARNDQSECRSAGEPTGEGENHSLPSTNGPSDLSRPDQFSELNDLRDLAVISSVA